MVLSSWPGTGYLFGIGIFAVVDRADGGNCRDPFRMRSEYFRLLYVKKEIEQKNYSGKSNRLKYRL